jgi:hypothetical protein
MIAACKRDGAPPVSLLQDATIVVGSDAAIAVARDAAPVAAIAPTAIELAIGLHAACAVMSDHTVRCWGANDRGQLGNGTQQDSATPVQPNLRGVQHLALGDDHACVLLDDASVACWGNIGFGPKPGPTLVPTGVVGVHDMARVFAVGGASCATAKDGPLVCWGDVDARGHRLQTGAHHAPTPVPGVAHVAALRDRAALLDDGSVVTWLDDGAPVKTEIAGATELATIPNAACALDGTGDAHCVGPAAPCQAPAPPPAPTKPLIKSGPHNRGHGPHRVGRYAPPPAPPPAKPSDVLPFGTKLAHLDFDLGTCAVSAGKQLVCLDDACKLARPWPAMVNVVEAMSTCVRLANGTVRCGVKGNAAAPVVDGIARATSLAGNFTRGCAIVDGGGVACWDGAGAATSIIRP